MQAETKLPGQKSRYTGVFNAYYTIGKHEGMAGLYKGWQRAIKIFVVILDWH
jgi:hypothetical protein